MRLDDFGNDLNVENQGRGGGFGFPGGGGFGLPLGRGGLGCGGIALLVVISLVLGINPLALLGGGGGGVPVVQQPAGYSTGAGGSTNIQQICAEPDKNTSCRVLSSLNRTWSQILPQYQAPGLSFYSGSGQSGCGAAQSAMGPFYCPADGKVYIDTSFYDEMSSRMGAPGDFVQGYIMAHEVGHHIQHLLGTAEQVRAAQQRASRREGNALSVRLELQADCYAGVWAARARNRDGSSVVEPGDIQEGLRAAQAIGDDALQRASQGAVVPESFTHGTSAQRQFWLNRGLQTGDPSQCDTFNADV